MEEDDGDDNDVRCVENALKVGSDLFGKLSTTSALPTLNDDKVVPSPVKEALSGSGSPKHHPSYHFLCIDHAFL